MVNLMDASTGADQRDSAMSLLSPKPRSSRTRHGVPSLLLLLLLLQPSLYAQQKYTFSQFGTETGRFFTQPLHWEASDWLKLGLMGAGTFAAMQADQPIRSAVLRDRRYFYSVPIVGGRVWGELYMPVALFTLFGAHSLIADDNGTRKIAYEIGQASLYAGALTFLLKGTLGRARPYTEEGRGSFHPFIFLSNDFHSMPGGHTTAGFVLSTVLSRNVHSPVLKGLAYVPALFTFVSRVYQDEHWFSDDLIGAALGYVVATWVVDQHEQEDSRVGLTSVFPLTVKIIIN
jgi:membrane-associated phospholipid phosphatase